jgi:hypothetical protein
MQRDTGHLMDEADIGSGEKKSGQRDTEQEISKVHNPKMDKGSVNKEEKQSGRDSKQDGKSADNSGDRSSGK